MFDEVVVVLADNSLKKRRLDAEEMVEAIKKTLEAEQLTNVKVKSY